MSLLFYLLNKLISIDVWIYGYMDLWIIYGHQIQKMIGTRNPGTQPWGPGPGDQGLELGAWACGAGGPESGLELLGL